MRFSAAFIISLFFLACKKKNIIISKTPLCIQEKIDAYRLQPVQNPKASIWQYEYNGHIVYYTPPACCDQYGLLYDSACHIICAPDGGITGAGDGTCKDFFANRKNEKLIWQDSR